MLCVTLFLLINSYNFLRCLFFVQPKDFLYRAAYKSESKWSLKTRSDEHQRFARNCDCDKKEIAKHSWGADHNFSWDQNKVVDRESRLILRKIKESIDSLKNPNRINKIPYMLPKIWLPNLR